MTKLRVLYFGSGGGKGVTHMMVNLAVGHARRGRVEPYLVFRRKRGQPLAEQFRRQLAEAGVAYCEVVPSPKSRLLAELERAMREFRPEVFVGQGYPEHIWGRFAAQRAGVPVLLQVEQNHEHYKWLHLRRTRRLAAQTGAIVAVSHAVADNLRRLGLPAEKLRVIYNTVRLDRFCAAARPWAEREPVVMSTARFGRQKDHATLLRAIALLREAPIDSVFGKLFGEILPPFQNLTVACTLLAHHRSIVYQGWARDLYSLRRWNGDHRPPALMKVTNRTADKRKVVVWPSMEKQRIRQHSRSRTRQSSKRRDAPRRNGSSSSTRRVHHHGIMPRSPDGWAANTRLTRGGRRA